MKTVVRVLLVLMLSAAPAWAGSAEPVWDLPENVSSFGEKIDSLYWMITWIMGVIFIGTEAVLLWCLFRYRWRKGVKSEYSHGNRTAELIWTVIPAGILVWLAFYQKSTWDQIKAEVPSEDDGDVVLVEVLAKQFDWSFRYRGKDDTGKLAPIGSKWDIYTDRLYVPTGKKIVFHLGSSDVIHSFWLPHFRVKQDAVPGLSVRGWFDTAKLNMETVKAVDWTKLDPAAAAVPREGGRWFEIVCAELCGPQHYAMSGELVVIHAADFDKLMERLHKQRDEMLKDYESGSDPRLNNSQATLKLWANFRRPAEAQEKLRQYQKKRVETAGSAGR